MAVPATHSSFHLTPVPRSSINGDAAQSKKPKRADILTHRLRQTPKVVLSSAGALQATNGSTVRRKDDGVLTASEEGDRIRRLQNGSDVRGVALEGEKGRAVDLTYRAVAAIAESFGEWVSENLTSSSKDQDVKSIIRVSFGRDPRLSGPALSAAVFAGLARAGCQVFDMGLATTPACFMSTVLQPFAYDASIMMTASHLPYTRNGLKFFTKRGGLSSEEVEEICDRAVAKSEILKDATIFDESMASSSVTTQVDFMSAYSEHLCNIIRRSINHPSHYETPLKGFKVIVNAGNGSGGFFARSVLDKLGADTSGSLHLDPDGMFPNHTPNPEDSAAMSITQAAVLEHEADLGVVFDTDVDRSGVVDSAGRVINGDRLIALMSAIVLEEHPQTTVVTDARTSVALTEFITAKGGNHCLYRVGYRNVISKGIQLNEEGIETHLMMETTGHGALKENYFLDDGAYMVVRIIIEMVRLRIKGSSEGVGDLIKDLRDPKESVELRMNILGSPKEAKMKGAQVVEALKTYIQEGKMEGWELDRCGDCWVSDGCLVDSNGMPMAVDAHMYRARICDENNGEHGWIHIRQSVHNPNIAVNMQSHVQGGCRAIARTLRDKFLRASGLDEVIDVTQVDAYAS